MSLIPTVFHFVWTGPPMPDRLATYVASWSQVHPDWGIKIWRDADLCDLANQHLFDRADDIAGRYAGQFRADVARLEILHRHGGVYVDCDFEARHPIDDLCTVPAWAAWETNGVWVNNAIVGSIAGHPLWGELIEALPANVARHSTKRPNIMSGPQFITPHIVGRPDVTLYPSEWFYPYRWDELDRQGDEFPEARAVHHWDNTRKRRGLVDA